MRISCLAIVLFLSLGLVLQPCAGSSPRSNVTRLTLEDEDSTSELNSEDVKERYRRLIRYMNYYVTNNNVGFQTQNPENYVKSLNRPPPRPHYTFRPSSQLRQNNRYQSNTNNNKKFIPSVQYNPKDIGPDNKYFSPLLYGTKLNQKESHTYSTHPKTRPVYSSFSRPSVIPDNRYFATEKPLREQNYPRKGYLPSPPLAKPMPARVQEDYPADYEDFPREKLPVNPNEYDQKQLDEFESFRYVIPNPEKIEHPQAPEPPRLRPIVSQNFNYKVPSSQLQQIVKSLQLTDQLPEMLNTDNVDSSITTLVEILNLLRNSKIRMNQQEQISRPVQLRPIPLDYYFKEENARPEVFDTNYYVTPNTIDIPEEFLKLKPARPINPVTPYKTNIQAKPTINTKFESEFQNKEVIDYYAPEVQDIDVGNKQTVQQTVPLQNIDNFRKDPYKVNTGADDILENERLTAPINIQIPSLNYPALDGKSNSLEKIPQNSDYGATRGKPHVDYPTYFSIPMTRFNCKDQRYKGFFGDPETRCQVWHYCDLNGGKSSFLCPNGTIFNQAELTCDWWFNVNCESTTQLYVLNERLYKYILPFMPKFPEDFMGPEVDRYLELKFKEMEAMLKEKLLKMQQEKEKAEQESKGNMPTENETE